METTHNFFEYFIFLIHQVCFYTSPIDTDRLQSESKARQQIGINELPRSNNPAEPQDLKTHWSRMLLHPLKLIPLIKRYHKVNSWFFLIFTTHFLILIHFTVKAIVYTFYVGKNEEKITYFNSIYYPPLAGSIPAPHVFNYVFVALSINCLCFRLLSAHRLIKNSIINAGNYKKLYAPQLNLASFTLFQLPVREWIALVRNAFEHRKKIHEDPAAWRAHLEYSPLIHQQLDRFRHRDLLFQLNVLDYEECYKNVDCFKLNKRKERYKTWHHPVPLMRFSATLTGFGIIVAFHGIILAIFISVGVFVGTLYLELRSSFASGQETGLLEVFSIWKSHLVDPLHLLRMFEINMLYTIQLPEQFDCFMSIFDNFVLTSRANKLIDVFKDDLNLCRQMNLSHNCHHRCLSYDETVFLSDEKLLFRKQNKLAQNKNNCVHCQVRKRDLSNLNRRIQHHVRLASLVHSEFLNLRETLSMMLNLNIIGNGIGMVYVLSSYWNVSTIPHWVVLTVSFLICIVAAISALISCARIEKAFKTLYRLMGRLVVYQFGLLDFKSVGMLTIGSESFERKEDRSFLIGGLYSITFDSVVPVSRLSESSPPQSTLANHLL